MSSKGKKIHKIDDNNQHQTSKSSYLLRDFMNFHGILNEGLNETSILVLAESEIFHSI